MENNKIILFTKQNLLSLGIKNLLSMNNKPFLVEMCDDFGQFSNGHMIILDNSLLPDDNILYHPKQLKKLKKSHPYIPIILYTRETLLNTEHLFDLGINAIVYKNRHDSHTTLLSYIDLLLKHPTIIIRDHFNRSEIFSLKEKEMEILNLICQGMRNKDIAKRLCLSIPTVRRLYLKSL